MNDPRSRREREVMDILYRLGRAGVADVRSEMADPPSYSAVRALFATLERKGQLTHTQEGKAYIYAPAVPVEVARQGALQRLVDAFFNGSAAQAAVALLQQGSVDAEEAEQLAALIAQARDDER